MTGALGVFDVVEQLGSRTVSYNPPRHSGVGVRGDFRMEAS